MSESDTMFNEQDRRYAAVQLMVSTDPSYDNRTIASTLKIQIWIATSQGDENKVSGYGYGLWCGFKWGPYHADSHLRSRHESQHRSVPVCAEECGDPLVQSGGLWQTLGESHKCKVQAWLQKECYDFVPFSHWPPSPPTWTRWTTSFGHTSRTSPTWPPTNTKASLITAICRVFAEYSLALVEKACFHIRISIEAVIEAEGGYIE